MSSIIYIIYNADASIKGKLDYALRKVKAPAGQSACSACDLTHAGYRLTETAEWTTTKKQIGAAEVRQLHRDELDQEIIDYSGRTGLKYPAVLGKKTPNDSLELLMTGEDLAGCAKDHAQFLKVLRQKAAEKDLNLD